MGPVTREGAPRKSPQSDGLHPRGAPLWKGPKKGRGPPGGKLCRRNPRGSRLRLFKKFPRKFLEWKPAPLKRIFSGSS